MPAFGYILLLNDNVHQYLTVKYDGWLIEHLHLPGVWRIWLLFYGSFLLAAATILYSSFCPDEIKRYPSAFEMADGETEHQYNLGQFKIVQDNLGKLYANLSKWESSVLISTKPALHLVEGNIGDPRAALSTLSHSSIDDTRLATSSHANFYLCTFCSGTEPLGLTRRLYFPSSYGTRSQAAFHLISAADKEDVSPILSQLPLQPLPAGFIKRAIRQDEMCGASADDFEASNGFVWIIACAWTLKNYAAQHPRP